MRRTRAVLGLAAAAAASAFAAGPAAATETVDDNRAQCPSAPHTSIQAGVNAASPGELVLVCDGVYREVVTIAGPAKDGVRLVANATLRATINQPDDVIGNGIVQILGADNVQVRRFVIDGDNELVTEPHAAVFLDRGATGGLISENLITQDDADAGAFACGVALLDSSRATIDRNRIEQYEACGIEVQGRSRALITRNTLRASPTLEQGFAPQKGIYVTSGQAEILGNQISGNRSSAANTPGAGVEDHSGGFGFADRISGNRVSDNDVGLLLNFLNNSLVSYNSVSSNSQQGILLGAASTGNKIERNDALGNGGLDCEDGTAGSNPAQPAHPRYTTRNLWVNNKGLDADPGPICTPSGNAGPPVQ